MRLLALTLAFLLALSSLPAMAGTPAAAPSEAPSSLTAAPAPAALVEASKQPTLRDMLAQSTRADFASGDRPASTAAAATIAPAQTEAAPAKKSHKTMWIVIGCIVGAAAIWAIADSGGGDSNGSGGGGGY